MAAQHAPPQGGGAASEPVPQAGDGGTAPGETAAEATRPTGQLAAVQLAAGRDDGAATPRGRRLLPSGPVLVHAPLLLGLDDAGGEHPQGPGYEDDEDLVGRVWGCRCGWRGTVRDVSTRPFHPQVGDGGGLRRQRLARSDRDARSEIETHLAESNPAPADPLGAVSPSPPPVSPRPPVGVVTLSVTERSRPRGRRRRLTVPRDAPPATTPVTTTVTANHLADDERNVPKENGTEELTTSDADEPSVETSVDLVPPTLLKPVAADQEAHDAKLSTVDVLKEAVARVDAARVELAEAEAALKAAVAAARDRRS